MQILLIILGVLFLISFILPIFHRVFNAGTAVGVAMGGVFLLLGLKWNELSFNQLRCGVFFVFVVLIVYSLFYWDIMKNGKIAASNQQTIIVLGCRIMGDIPSHALEKRIDAAFDFLVRNPESVAILSGGQGKDENLSEALCMYRHLVDSGIDKSRLFMEDKSVNTDENIRFSLKLIEEKGLKKEVAIATSEYHQKRTKMICKRYGLEAYAESSKSMPILIPTFVTREMLAVVKEALFSNIKIK